MIYLFVIMLFLIFYHIIGYPVILSFFSKQKEVKYPELENFPTITVICAAYNEEKHIKEKIESFLKLDYPKDKIKMLVISDDSTDKTNDIVREFSNENIELIVQKPRRGKQSAHNMIMSQINTKYILSTDANSIFQPDTVTELVRILESDPQIGLVSGECKLVKTGEHDSGEGIYWKYECSIKNYESNIKTIIGACGSVFLIRRELFTEIDESSPDDFERTLIVIKKGYLAKYNPKSFITEEVTEKSLEELSRKIRIVTQEWQAIARQIVLLNPFKFGYISAFLISHKIIRWLIGYIYLLSLIFALLSHSEFLLFAYVIPNLLIILLGVLGLFLEKLGKQKKILKLFTYWLTMIIISLRALLKAVIGKKYSIWTQHRENN